MDKDEAIEMAQKAEETGNLQDLVDAVNALIEALEQPPQEPYGWITAFGDLYFGKNKPDYKDRDWIAIYTRPYQCQECKNLKHDLDSLWEINKELLNKGWVGLTEDEIKKCFKGNYRDIYNAIEQALKKKNYS